jgi:hypothetical protein
MAPYEEEDDDDYFESSLSEGDVDIVSEDDDDQNVLRTGRRSLGLSRYYVPEWTGRDAFREFFQNWYVQSIISYWLEHR